MNLTCRLQHHSEAWLFENKLAPHVDAFSHYLCERRYAQRTVDTYLGCLAHLAYWMRRHRFAVHRLNEGVVGRFLDEHLPVCDCPRPVNRTRSELRAALRHVLVVLRSQGVIGAPRHRATPVDEELQRFNNYMVHVRGLAGSTRRLYLPRCAVCSRHSSGSGAWSSRRSPLRMCGSL